MERVEPVNGDEWSGIDDGDDDDGGAETEMEGFGAPWNEDDEDDNEVEEAEAGRGMF